MSNVEKKNRVQQEALKHWLKADKRGTCEIITGLGKTFIGLHALYTMPKNEGLHLFLAEAIDRERDLEEQIQLYNKIFDRDVHRDYTLRFYCYQTVCKWKDHNFGLVIADEIHDSLTPIYGQFYLNNKFQAILGLSATIVRGTKYEIDGKTITKGQMLDKVAPVCFKYGMKESKADKTSRALDIYVIHTQLEQVAKTVKGGSKKKPFFQTEQSAYDYWDKTHKKSFFLPSETKEEQDKKTAMISSTSKRRSEILYNSRGKIAVTRELIDNLDGKNIVFANSIDSLLQITPNVISSRNTDEKNNNIRSAFEANKIRTIGSFKKLKQGANLSGLDNCIIMSYYGINKDLIQRIGRLRDNGEIGRVFILLTPNTQEEVWFSKMLDDMAGSNIIYCPNLDFCLKRIR